MNKILMLFILICICVLSSEGQNITFNKKTKKFVTNLEIEKIPDTLLSKMRDTGLIKIGYNSFYTTKLFEYIFINDISFDGGKLKINLPLKKALSLYPKITFKKLKIKDIEAEDGFWEQSSYFVSEKSYFYAEADMDGKNNKVLSIIIQDNKIKMDKISLNVGDPITKICDYFEVSCMELKRKLDTSIKNKNPLVGIEQYVDIDLYENNQKISNNFLRYVWNQDTQKIIRIEVTFNN